MTTPDSLPPDNSVFRFRQFSIAQDRCAMKVGTDGVLLGAWVETAGVQRALDIGAGTGLIALMLAQRSKDTIVDGVEVDAIACVQAAENMQQSLWSQRLCAIHSSIQDYARTAAHTYDLVVSNPPFFTGGVLSESESRLQVRHTVKLPHGELLMAARRLLAPKGVFAVILPLLEGLRFMEMARSYHLYCERMTEVHTKAGKPASRLLLQFVSDIPDTMRQDALVLTETDGSTRTPAYHRLTEAFYLA
ncbi:MAG: methyltransferase [Saprospiraceae bacterium]|nr:methyltransferase [Saprospiraceae bacterium]